MSGDFNLDDLLERAHASGNAEARVIARKISKDWEQRVLPSASTMDKLHKLLKAPEPCVRLGYDGRCQGWLKKYGAECGLVVPDDGVCPFASDGKTPSDFIKCPGYRSG